MTEGQIRLIVCRNIQEIAAGKAREAVREWSAERGNYILYSETLGPCCSTSPADILSEEGRDKDVGGRKTPSDRAMLLVCHLNFPQPILHARLRQLGIHPLGTSIIDMRGSLPQDKALADEFKQRIKILLQGGLARVKAFPGTIPGQERPRILLDREKLDRRSLLTLTVIDYQPTPAMQRRRCKFREGCRLCQTRCPTQAIIGQGDKMVIDRDKCLPCGSCLSSCPAGAITLPKYSQGEIGAQVRAVLAPSSGQLEPRGIAFYCNREGHPPEYLTPQGYPYHPGWFFIELPSEGLITASWILYCFALGAAAVTIITCRDRCPRRIKDELKGHLAYCQELLSRLAQPGQRLVLLTSHESDLLRERFASLPAPWLPYPPEKDPLLLDPYPERRNYLSLMRLLGHTGVDPSTLKFTHPYSPFAKLRLEEGLCNGCGICARSCPTSALYLEERSNNVRLIYNPSLCWACGKCAEICPQKALQIERITDPLWLNQGTMEVFEDLLVCCSVCKTPFINKKLLRQLQQKGGVSIDLSSQVCGRCRPLNFVPP